MLFRKVRQHSYLVDLIRRLGQGGYCSDRQKLCFDASVIVCSMTLFKWDDFFDYNYTKLLDSLKLNTILK